MTSLWRTTKPAWLDRWAGTLADKRRASSYDDGDGYKQS